VAPRGDFDLFLTQNHPLLFQIALRYDAAVLIAGNLEKASGQL
jgi:hypothetical protein